MSTEETLFLTGIGFVISTVGQALYGYFKRKVNRRVHERRRIINEIMLRGIK